MNVFQRFFSLVAILALSACAAAGSSSTLEALNKAQAVGSPFTKALTVEYRAYANDKSKKFMDHADALHFARKGMASASGVVVMPEVLDDWDLSDKNLVDLSAARAALVDALENGGREVASEKAAVAQAKFDCWVEMQEQKWNADPACKAEFNAALKDVNSMLGPKSAPAPVEPVKAEDESFPAPVAAVAPKPETPIDQANFIVFFDWDQASVTSSANDVLDAVSNEVKNRSDIKSIVVVGHTDTSGSAAYNQKLSLRRADAVKAALAARGVSANVIMIEGRGKSDLMVKTANNVREPANRRAQISLQ